MVCSKGKQPKSNLVFHWTSFLFCLFCYMSLFLINRSQFWNYRFVVFCNLSPNFPLENTCDILCFRWLILFCCPCSLLFSVSCFVCDKTWIVDESKWIYCKKKCKVLTNASCKLTNANSSIRQKIKIYILRIL